MSTTPDYHKEIAGKYPKNEWVKPTNLSSNDYDVFANLFEWGKVKRRIEYHYRNKLLIGSTHYFKYNNL